MAGMASRRTSTPSSPRPTCSRTPRRRWPERFRRGVDTDFAQPARTGARFNLGERSRVKDGPDDRRRAAGASATGRSIRRRGSLREHRRDLRLRPGDHAPDRRRRLSSSAPTTNCHFLPVVINARLGEWLFPFSYANRGVATMFEPRTYVERLDRELTFDRPDVLHHAPDRRPLAFYYTADTPFGIPASDGGDGRPRWRERAARPTDVPATSSRCSKRKGALENTIVVVLSDRRGPRACRTTRSWKPGPSSGLRRRSG